MSLTKLFNDVKKTSYLMIKKNKKADWFAYWNPLKNILSDINGNASHWIKQDSKITKHVMNEVPEFLVYPNEEKELIEHNHFIIQTIRIPLNDEPNIRRIIQIALNIGQCKAFGNKHNHLLKNRTKITDYISKKDIDKLSLLISKDVNNKVYKHINKYK